MSLTFDFTVNDENQREAQAIIFGLKSDVATKHSKQISDTVDFLLNSDTIPFLEKMGQGAELVGLIDSLPNFQKQYLAQSLSDRFLNQSFQVSRELKTWCLQTRARARRARARQGATTKTSINIRFSLTF